MTRADMESAHGAPIATSDSLSAGGVTAISPRWGNHLSHHGRSLSSQTQGVHARFRPCSTRDGTRPEVCLIVILPHTELPVGLTIAQHRITGARQFCWPGHRQPCCGWYCLLGWSRQGRRSSGRTSPATLQVGMTKTPRQEAMTLHLALFLWNVSATRTCCASRRRTLAVVLDFDVSPDRFDACGIACRCDSLAYFVLGISGAGQPYNSLSVGIDSDMLHAARVICGQFGLYFCCDDRVFDIGHGV